MIMKGSFKTSKNISEYFPVSVCCHILQLYFFYFIIFFSILSRFFKMPYQIENKQIFICLTPKNISDHGHVNLRQA